MHAICMCDVRNCGHEEVILKLNADKSKNILKKIKIKGRSSRIKLFSNSILDSFEFH